MRWIKHFFIFLLITLIINSFFCNFIKADDEKETLEINFISNVDIEGIGISISVDPFEGVPYNPQGNIEVSEGFNFDPAVSTPYINIWSNTIEKNKEYTLKIKELNRNQEYSVSLYNDNNASSTIEYLCAGGRVKKSFSTNENNSVSCKIHDSSNPGSVTDSSMINKINITIDEIPDVQYTLPLVVQSEHLKGAIAQSCSQSGPIINSTILEYATDLDELKNYTSDYPNPNIYIGKYEMMFSDSKKKQDNKPIIEYKGDNVEHWTEGFTDIFRSTTSTNIPIPLDEFEPGVVNTFYVRNHIDRYVSLHKSIYWKVEFELDNDLNLISYKIFKIIDENGNDINEQVNNIEVFNYDDRSASLDIRNFASSNKEDNFDYEIKIYTPNSVSIDFQVYFYGIDSSHYNVSFNSNNSYNFTLKHGDEIEIHNIPIGSKYTIKQIKKGQYTTTVATEYNSKDYITIDLSENNTHYIADNIQLELDTIYKQVDEFSTNTPATEPCHPPVVPGGGPIPINFGINWSNRTENDLALRIEKYTQYPAQMYEDYLANATLKGAQFTLIGSDGMQVVEETDENGIATFTGLDESQSYIIRETKAPNGYYPLGNLIFTYTGSHYSSSNWLYRQKQGQFKDYVEWYYWNKDNHIYTMTVPEEVSFVILEVAKYGLLDNDKYNEPLFQIKNFTFKPDTNQSEEVAYKDFWWPRSYFEPLEGVEFLMTLDSDPDNPMYRYHAITDEDGRAVFERELDLQPYEEYSPWRKYAIYYGEYTIEEINTPEGYRPMEKQRVEIKAPENGRVLYDPNFDIDRLASVMKVVNEKRTGDLTISKQVNGENADENKEFTFTINLKDEENNPITTKFKYEGFKTGVITSGDSITLKHNESITIKYLPENTKYEVIEESVDKYTTTVNNNNSNSIEGVIVDKENKEIKYVNTIIPEKPTEPEKPVEEKPKDPPKTPEYNIPKTGV